MEFGLLTPTELRDVDFTLPSDGPQTIETLKNKKPAKDPSFYVGCAKWGRKEWVNLIYPPKTKEANFLDEYVKVFNAIEFNAAFYNIPKPDQVQKWAEKAGDHDFIFCPKFSQPISHIKRLNNAKAETDRFLEGIHGFGKHLGPCFLQMSDNFGPKNISVMENYLEHLPADLSVFVELRHKEWFGDPAARKAVFAMLARHKKGAIITDANGRRDCLHMELPTPEAFIRFVGNGTKYKESDRRRVDDWVVRLKDWLDRGLEKVYFFLHQHDEADTPYIAQYTIDRFNRELGSHLAEVKLIEGQKGLFGG